MKPTSLRARHQGSAHIACLYRCFINHSFKVNVSNILVLHRLQCQSALLLHSRPLLSLDVKGTKDIAKVHG